MPESLPVIGVLDQYEGPARQLLTDTFAAGFSLRFADGSSPAAHRSVAREAEFLLAGWSAVPAEVIDAAPRLRLIHKLGSGVDRVDLDSARRRNIAVLLAAGINADAVAEMTILLMLAVLRDTGWAVDELRAGRFRKEALRGSNLQLAGLSVGLVGLGHIGREVARRLSVFRCGVSYFDVVRASPDDEHALGVRYRDLDDLLGSCDLVSLHVPSAPSTRNLMSRSRLASMKRGSFLVNTARGNLVDEEALAGLLASGHIAGAGLDVTYPEPIAATSPLLRQRRVVVTPHVGGSVYNNFQRVTERARHNIDSFVTGMPVDPRDVVVWPAQKQAPA